MSDRISARTILAATVALAACSSPPPTPDRPEPDKQRPEPLAPEGPDRQKPRSLLAPLQPNGLAAYVEEAPAGNDAQVQLGVLAGSLFVAPGLAELAARVFVESSDPTTGSVSLSRAIARLGGTVETRLGLTTTWIDVRVPRGRLRPALAALRRALDTMTQSRTQIERMRDDLIAERTADVLATPLLANARALLQAESGSGQYIDALLDLDPSQVTLFHSRLYRPERCLLAISAPLRVDAIRSALNDGENSLGAWMPAAPMPGATDLLARNFESGLYWSEGDGLPPSPDALPGTTRVALVLQLPDPTKPSAALHLMMHSVLTLDGTGGRLERMQEEAQLDYVQWDAHIERGADSLALVLTSNARPEDVPTLWHVYGRARDSLRAVPPTESELRLALRRAQLNARLSGLRDSDRLRLRANLAALGSTPGQLVEALEALESPERRDLKFAADAFLESPAWMIAIGPGRPVSLPGLRPFDALPRGFDPVTQNAPNEQNLAAADAWLEAARAALGDADTFARLVGFDARVELTVDGAPGASDDLSWRDDGTLTRVRTVLGQRVETRLEGDRWTETLDEVTKSLVHNEAAALRRAMQRHPLMLLAAHARGELRFRPIARRSSGDREMFVLEAVGDRFDRLRMHIDTESRLVRIVESWERLPEGTLVHVRESWSDYRHSGPLRTPHRSRSEWNDGERRSEAVYTGFEPVVRPR